MSNILKGILNESNPFYGHNDPAKEYGADAPSYRKRGPYSHTDDEDDGNPFAEYERQQRMFARGRAEKAAKEKAQRDSDHDRLATGTNEGLDDPWGDQGNFAGDKPVNVGSVSMKNIQNGDTVKYLGQTAKVVAMSKDRKYSRITISSGFGGNTKDVLTTDLQQLGQGKEVKEDNTDRRMRMDDYYALADAIQNKLRQAIQIGNKELIQKYSNERDELDARVKQYGLLPEAEQLDEISNEKLAQYKTAAAADTKKADSEGDYKRGDKRFSGIVKATKKQFANDEKKSAIGQGINEFAVVPNGPKGPKDYGQPNSSRYIGGNKFVVGTTNNYVLTATIDKWGLEWDEDDEVWFLDSPGAAHIADASEGEIELPPPREQRNQIHDLVTDYLNSKNLADLQKVAAYYGHSDDGEMATNEEFRPTTGQASSIRKQTAQKMNPGSTKFVWKRPNQIGGSHTEQELLSMGFRKSTKHNVWGGTQDMWNRLSNNLDENLGDQLKATSLDALVQAKLAIEKQREAEIEAWKQDFEKNTVQKAQQGLRREFQPTPVAQPGEKHSVLKARLAQLNNAIEKQALLDKLIDKLERKGLMTPAMKNDTDTRMHVRYGAKDNYQSLNKKLDNAIAMLQNRLAIRKISGLKEEQEIKFVLVINGQDKFKFPTKEEALKVLKDYKEQFPKANAKIEPRVIAKTMYEEDELDENCWKGYHKEGNKELFGKTVPNCVKNEDVAEGVRDLGYDAQSLIMKLRRDVEEKRLQPTPQAVLAAARELAGDMEFAPQLLVKQVLGQGIAEEQHSCPHCGGEMVSEELMNEKKDACYYKVKSRYKVWPSAYASGALVKCRKKGASNWGNSSKNESSILEGLERADENLHQWFKEKWVRFGPDGKIRGDCARGDDSEGKPKCLPQSKAHSLGKKGRASAASRKRREDPNPERSGKAINVNTKKKANEDQLEEKWSQKYKDSINCSNPKGFSQKAHCQGKKK